jgi:hypothetical protein
MANKIAKVDAEAMNNLYGSELTRMGVKYAAAADDKGGPKDPQAFEDHQAYLETLKAVMAEDGKSSGNQNDPLVD